MTTTGTDLTPSAAGLPSEAQMLAWAAELGGGTASVPAGNSGADWARLASDVVRSETAAASSEAYSPTLVSASKAGTSSAAAEGEKASSRSRAAVGTVPVDKIRADFPILHERLGSGKSLVWFDNGATTQKPIQVIDKISDYYKNYNSNIHRGAHTLAARATDAYEEAVPLGIGTILLTLINIIVLLSANLGVMNLLPFPALDGGRLLMMLIEGIRGKRADPGIEARINMAGLALLMGFMVYITIHDILKLL